MPDVKIPRVAHGERTVFGESGEELNQLLAAVTALTGELAVLRQRVRSLEAIATAAGVLPAGALDRHEPDVAQREEQALWDEQLMRRVFYRYIERTK